MTSSVSDFGFTVKGGQYRVRVARDHHRGGYSAKLTSVGIGTIMEPNGASPSAALTTLVRELAEFGDRPLAMAIAKHAWFPLKV
jgi:hypothetical protein